MTTTDYLVVGGITSGELGPDCGAFDAEHFFTLLRKVVPSWYLDPLLSTPDSGVEVLQAFTKIAERVSLAFERIETGAIVATAPAGARALAVVAFARTSAGAAVTVKAGTIVSTSNGDRQFRLLQDVVFGGGDNGPHAGSVEAVAAGFEYNVRGPTTAANGDPVEGEIDTVFFPYLDPAYGDTTITVSQTSAAIGGADAQLDGLGADRGIDRELGEGDEAYRLRIHSLPDVVTPSAIQRNVARILDPLGVQWRFIETFEIGYQTCYDAPSPNVGTPSYQAVPPTNPAYDSNLFCLDDPRPLTLVRYANLSLGPCDYRGAFIIVIEGATILSYGFALDDPGMVPGDFRSATTGWQRGTPAPDGLLSDDPSLVFPAAYDGPDVAFDAMTAALYRLLVAVKAAGVLPVVVRVFS